MPRKGRPPRFYLGVPLRASGIRAFIRGTNFLLSERTLCDTILPDNSPYQGRGSDKGPEGRGPDSRETPLLYCDRFLFRDVPGIARADPSSKETRMNIYVGNL